MANVIDPYTTDGGASSSGLDYTAPTPATSTLGMDTLLELYVPAENTLVDFGAGTTPGIRMVTDNHTHLTAGTSLTSTVTPPVPTATTTISLGKPAGTGIAAVAWPTADQTTSDVTKLAKTTDPTDGFNVFTAGDKWETIEGKTFENYFGAATLTYGNTKTETVHGDTKLTYQSTKEETATGAVTETYNSSYDFTVGGDSTYTWKGDASQTVKGNSNQTIDGDSSVTINGKQRDTFKDDSFTYSFGGRNETYLGMDTSLSLVGTVDALAGVGLELNAGVTVAFNGSLDVAFNLATYEKTKFELEDKDFKLTSARAVLDNLELRILMAAMTIFK